MEYNHLFIYCTTNIINGKQYVGKHYTNDINDNYLGSGLLLNRSIIKHGKENFKREILEFCDSTRELNEKEMFWIEKLSTISSKNGYNLTKGGDGGNTISLRTQEEQLETKKKLSESIQKYWDNIAEEDKEERVSKIRGKKRSDESKARYSKAKKGIPKTKEHLENLSKSLKKAKAGKPTYNQKAVDMYDLDMNFLEDFVSIQDAGRKTGHNPYAICKICKGQKDKIKNHIFKYKE